MEETPSDESLPTGPDKAQGEASGPPPEVTTPPRDAEPRAADEPTRVFCSFCQKEVEPAGRGTCPTCGRFLPDHTVSLGHGLRSKKLAKAVDAYRTGLLNQLFAERGGRDQLDVVGRIACEQYALVCASAKTIEKRLDEDGLFTKTGRRRSAFDMLKSISETIDKLREKLPPVTVHPTQTTEDYSSLTDEQLHERLVALVLDSAARLEAKRSGTELVRQAAEALKGEPDIEDWLDIEDDDPQPALTVRPASRPEQEEQEPTAACHYCRRPSAACQTLKTEREDLWRAIHALHPDEVKRRTQEATDTMFKTMPHGSGFVQW